MPESSPVGYDPAGRTVAWSSFYDEARARLAAANFTSSDLDARRLVEERLKGVGSARIRRRILRRDPLLRQIQGTSI